MGRVAGVPVNVYSGLGDLAYGGAGTPVAFANRARSALGVSFTWASNYGPNPNNAAIDDNDATQAAQNDDAGPSPNVGMWGRCDLLAPRRIGRFRVKQGTRFAAAFDIQSSTDNVTWVTRASVVGQVAGSDTGSIMLATPITARYWRILCVTAGSGFVGAGDHWYIYSFEVDEVTTVGAGNPSRLPPPATRGVLGYDPDAGVPAWQPPGAAIADLGAGTAAAPAAYVGVDVAAAGPAQVALLTELNNLRAVVAALRVDRDADRTAINTLIARLEAPGILAP